MQEERVPPTYKEISEHFGFHVNAAACHVRALAKYGFIELKPGAHRGIRLKA